MTYPHISLEIIFLLKRFGIVHQNVKLNNSIVRNLFSEKGQKIRKISYSAMVYNEIFKII